MLKLGNLDVIKIYLGDIEVPRAYLGDIEVYSNIVTPQLMKITAIFNGNGSETPIMGSGTFDYSQLEKVVVNGVEYDFNTNNGVALLEEGENVVEYYAEQDNVTRMWYMFNGCNKMISIDASDWDSSNVMNTSSMFRDCSSLTTVSLFDTSNVIYIGNMFYGCSSLTTVPLFDTSSVTGMTYMFYGCSSLTTVPLFDTSSVTTMSNMFQDCSSLTSVPQFDTSRVTNMRGMFGDCSNLTTVSLLNTSRVTDMGGLFEGCSNLTTVPLLNTSRVTDMSHMFGSCSSLTTVPQFNTSNVTTMSNMFIYCSSLESLPLFDCSSLTSIIEFFGYNNITTLTTLGGFKDLKINWNDGNGLYRCPNLTYESVMNVINNLYDFRSNGDSSTTRTLKLNANSLALLNDDDKAIATSKGWILS